MLRIPNLYELMPAKYKPKQTHYKNESIMKISVPFRSIILGASGSGKTNLLASLLGMFNCFTKIMIFAKEIEEPMYQWLIDTFAKTEKKLKIDPGELLSYSNDPTDIPDYDSDRFHAGENTLIIFDDLINSKSHELSRVASLFTMGRKKNISCIFISQSWFRVPLIIRQNITTIFMLKVNSEGDLSRILKECQVGVTLNELKEMYRASTRTKSDFFLIDLEGPRDMRFRFCWEPFRLANENEESEDE